MTAVHQQRHFSRQQRAGEGTDELWRQYRADGDGSARARLLDRYLGLVHHVARSMAVRTPALEVDELVSVGTFGLMQALDSFDFSRGLAFSTYAIRRIRGAILDDLRCRDWAPRSTRAKRRQIEAAARALAERLGRAPRAGEVAEELGISLATYWSWRDESADRAVVSFGSSAVTDRQGGVTIDELIEDADAPAPDHGLAVDERRDSMISALAGLPERERAVVSLYYYEELNLRQIAEVLQVTESRISQIRSQALRRMRDALARDAE